MNLFKKLVKSRRSGLLSDDFSFWGVLVLLVLLVSTVVLSLVRIGVYDATLPLRYSTATGLYDRGVWYRPFAIVLFSAVVVVIDLALATYLSAQKSLMLSRGIIMVAISILSLGLVVLLNVVTGATI